MGQLSARVGVPRPIHRLSRTHEHHYKDAESESGLIKSHRRRDTNKQAEQAFKWKILCDETDIVWTSDSRSNSYELDQHKTIYG